MSVDAISGIGAQQHYSTNGGSTYTQLTDLAMLGAPGSPKIDQIEATPVDPTSFAKEFLLGLVEYGEVSFEQFYNKTRFTALNTLYTTRAVVTWKTIVRDNATATSASYLVYSGWLIECGLGDLKNKDPVVIKCKIKMTGAYAFTQGS